MKKRAFALVGIVAGGFVWGLIGLPPIGVLLPILGGGLGSLVEGQLWRFRSSPAEATAAERYCSNCRRFLAAGTATCGYCGKTS